MAKKYNGNRLDNGMFYSDSELLGLYRDAKDKSEQLNVIAELNLCSVEDVKKISQRINIETEVSEKPQEIAEVATEEPKGAMAKMKAFVKKAVDCCIE